MTFSNSLYSPLVSGILKVTIFWSEMVAIIMNWQSVKASMSFLNTKSNIFSSLVLLLSICFKLKLFVSSSSKFNAIFSGVLPAFTFGKKPASLLTHSTTLGGKLKSSVKINVTFSLSSFCVRYCHYSNTLLINNI